MAHVDAPFDPTTGPLSAELDAMRVIGAALARVRDPQARARVLRWAADCFDAQPPAAPAPPPAAAIAPASDPTLAVETLHELFEPIAADDILHEIFDVPMHAIAAEPEPTIAPRRPREEPARLDALVRGFAAEFQRLAIDWQGA
jgi:hypothetical protein